MSWRAFHSSAPFVWGVLALPAIALTLMWASGSASARDLLHPTGETSGRLLIVTMAITPLAMLFPRSSFWSWMRRRRRWFGVAAFAYALFHTALYIDVNTVAVIWRESLDPGIWTGWTAFAIFIPLALTSNDRCVRAMGRAWKRLQRLVYPAAVVTLLHWIFVHNAFVPALIHFVPLAGLEAYRVWRLRRPSRRIGV